jgi:nucleotide-binding universal stress UspA family protein
MSPTKRMNILLADDGSQHAQAAVELLQKIPLPAKSKIRVYRAFNSGQIPLIPEIERTLARTRAQLTRAGYKVETEMQLYSPAEGLLEHAQEHKPNLIVLGAKGLRSTASILLGGVAQQVMEYACCPVLIVRAPCLSFDKILLVTDGSPSSQAAARYLGKFPIPENAQVQIMHVLAPILDTVLIEPYYGAWQATYASYPIEEIEQLQKQEAQAGEALLERTCKLLQRYGINATTVLRRGDAATEIIDYVGDNQVDLIVAGSRGLSNFKSLWMGSVSRKLVHYSNCSVLIVKVPKKE